MFFNWIHLLPAAPPPFLTGRKASGLFFLDSCPQNLFLQVHFTTQNSPLSFKNKNFIRKTVPKARNNSGFGDGLSIYPFNRPQMTISSSISQLQPNISVSSELSLGLITSFIT